MDIIQESQSLQNETVELRRALHRVAEIAGTLPQTKSLISAELDHLGISWRKCNYDDGIIADIQGTLPGSMIAMRADVDALPIAEETGLSFASVNPGYFHGCGHDAHGAMLLSAAKIICSHRDKLRGSVRLIFQAGEESGTGGINMVKDHVLDSVERVFGLHIGTLGGKDLKSGQIAIVPGYVTCFKDKFRITVTGCGCHGGKPHEGVDAISIAAHIITSLEELFARELPAGQPATFTFGTFQSGSDINSVPGTAILTGGMRTKSPEIHDLMKSRTEEIIHTVAGMYRGKAEVEWLTGTKPVYNNPQYCKELADSAETLFNQGTIFRAVNDPLMGSDDFTNYAKERPSVYAILSSRNPSKHTDIDHHNPHFDIDEDVLWMGTALYCIAALKSA